MSLLTLLSNSAALGAGGGGGLTFFPPDSPVWSYTDCIPPDVNATRARWTRAYDDGPGSRQQYACPNVRVRTQTTASHGILLFESNGLIERMDARNFVVEIRRNGTMIDSFLSNTGTAPYGVQAVGRELGLGGGTKVLEALLPLGDGVDFKGGYFDTSGTTQAPPARPSKALLAQGNSIMQGFYATRSSLNFAGQLGDALNCQVIDMGYGGRTAVAADAAAMAGYVFDAVWYMIGTNDYLQHANTTAFQNAIRDYILAMRAHHPTIPLYICSLPPLINEALSPPASDYRAATLAGVTAAADFNTTYVAGDDIFDASGLHADGIHYVDAGFAAAALAAAAEIGSIP